MAGYLTDEEVARQADRFRHFHARTGAPFERWADSKDFHPEDRKAIRERLNTGLPLGWEGVEIATD